MFKNKGKKLISGLISIMIGTVVLTGCGSENKEFQGYVDKINAGKTTLLEASNINLSRNLLQETEGAKQKTLNEVVVSNTTKDWHMKSFNMDGLKPEFLGESLMAAGRSYFRGIGNDQWNENMLSNLKDAVGVSDISNMELTAKECKDVKVTSVENKEVYTIIMSEHYLNWFKEKGIKMLEKEIKECKASNLANEDTIKALEQSVELSEKTDYISAECIFTLDDTGVLVGLKTAYVFESPKLELDSNGKIKLGEELITMAMTSDIVINSYNDMKNEEFLEGKKQEL